MPEKKRWREMKWEKASTGLMADAHFRQYRATQNEMLRSILKEAVCVEAGFIVGTFCPKMLKMKILSNIEQLCTLKGYLLRGI